MKIKHDLKKLMLGRPVYGTRYSVRVTDRAGVSDMHQCSDWAHALVTARNLARDSPAGSPIDVFDTYRADLRHDGSFWNGLDELEGEQVDEAIAAGRELAGKRKVAT
jgi:hypothetical protein